MANTRPPLTTRDELRVPDAPKKDDGVQGWLVNFVRELKQAFRLHVHLFPAVISGELKPQTHTNADLPAAATVGASAIAYVSDGAAGTKFRGSDGSAWVNLDAAGGGGGAVPTGTGFRHVTGGVEDGASKSVDTVDINPDQVTYAKIQNVSATDKLLGRAAAGAGDIEEIPLTGAGRALIDDVDAAAQRATLGLGALAVLSSVGTGNLADDSVTYAKIQNVTDDRLLGRSAGSDGDVQEIEVDDSLSLEDGMLSLSPANNDELAFLRLRIERMATALQLFGIDVDDPAFGP